MAPKVSILIVSFNVRAALLRALRSLPVTAEVVVVDNASADGSADAVAAHFSHVTLVRSPTNLGFGRAINLAAQRASGRYFLLLNPDAWLTEGALDHMVAQLERRQAAALGPRQVDEQGRLQLSVGPRPTVGFELVRRTLQRQLDRPHTLGARLMRWALDRALHAPTRVPWVAGSALLVRRAQFEAIGGFDPDFFLYFEDIDFCLRLRRAGGSVLYDPTVTVGHSRGASASTRPGLASLSYRRSQARFAQLHLPALDAVVVRAWARHRGSGENP